MDRHAHAAPKAESTLLGGAERFIAKKVADLRGQIGCRLNLSIQELPALAERERASSVLEELCKEPELSAISDELRCLLQEVHQALLAHTLAERHSAFFRAVALLKSSETLKQALETRYTFSDEVEGGNDAVRLAYSELALAAQSLRDLTWWARHGHFYQSEQVSIYIARAHRWIFEAGHLLL